VDLRIGLDRCGKSRRNRDSMPGPSSPYPTTLPGPLLSWPTWIKYVSSHKFFKDGFNIIIQSRCNLPRNVNHNVTCGLGNTSTDSQYQVLCKFFIEVRRQTLGIDWLGPPTMHVVINVMGLHYVLRLTQKLKNTCWPLRQWKQ